MRSIFIVMSSHPICAEAKFPLDIASVYTFRELRGAARESRWLTSDLKELVGPNKSSNFVIWPVAFCFEILRAGGLPHYSASKTLDVLAVSEEVGRLLT